MATLVAGLDLETTDLDPEKGARIIEIGIVFVQYHDGVGKLVGKYEQRLNPECGIAPAAQAVHGIALEDLYGKPLWEEVGPKVAQLIERADLIVAHNGNSFDAPFLAHEFLRIGVQPPDTQWFDTMVSGRFATPMGKSPTLAELCFASSVPYDPAQAHGATYDVSVMLACFFSNLKTGFFKMPASV